MDTSSSSSSVFSATSHGGLTHSDQARYASGRTNTVTLKTVWRQSFGGQITPEGVDGMEG